MNVKVFILAIAAVTVGLVELIVGGVLPMIAADLDISIGLAGQLITLFALVYAIAGPILLSVTAKVERKRLLLITLLIFVFGNVLTFISPNFTFVLIARIVMAASASLVIVLALTISGKIVAPIYRARALGIIFMGVSSALVLGVPIGIVVADLVGWRSLFLGIAFMAVISMILIHLFLEKIQTDRQIPLRTQFNALGNLKIMGAHVAVIFMLAGHYTFYAYFAPFLETSLQLGATWISICYFLFGLAAVSGGALGGILADKFGSTKTILTVISTFAVVLFFLPYATLLFPLFLVVMMMWGALSWSINPATQNYLIETDPVNSDIHQSFNNSAIQVGIAIGSGVGGLVIEQTNSVTATSSVGAMVVVLALGCAIFSLSRPKPVMQTESERMRA